MARTKTALFAHAVMALSALTLVAIFAWGIASGALSADAIDRGAGGRGELVLQDDLEGGVLALQPDEAAIGVFDPLSGERRGRIEADGDPGAMVPTPGGVSVFVTRDGSADLRVYSTTNYEHETTVTLESERLSEDRRPEHLLFSENGDTLFVTWKESPVVSVYAHEMLELELRTEFEIADSFGPVYRNRRATRLYRKTPDGLAVVYARNGDHIETVEAGAEHWRFNPSYTHIWGTDSDGGLWVVDERSTEARRLDAPPVADVPPVLPSDSDTALVLTADREAVLAFDARSGRALGTIELPTPAAHLAESGAGTVWAVAETGEVTAIDPVGLQVHERLTLEGGAPTAVSASIVQRDGNFACF